MKLNLKFLFHGRKLIMFKIEMLRNNSISMVFRKRKAGLGVVQWENKFLVWLRPGATKKKKI